MKFYKVSSLRNLLFSKCSPSVAALDHKRSGQGLLLFGLVGRDPHISPAVTAVPVSSHLDRQCQLGVSQ